MGIITDTTDIQKTIRKYYKTDNLNNPIPTKRTKFIGKKSSKKKTSGPEISTGKFYQIFKE